VNLTRFLVAIGKDEDLEKEEGATSASADVDDAAPVSASFDLSELNKRVAVLKLNPAVTR
jgi:hypothetical protein